MFLMTLWNVINVTIKKRYSGIRTKDNEKYYPGRLHSKKRYAVFWSWKNYTFIEK